MQELFDYFLFFIYSMAFNATEKSVITYKTIEKQAIISPFFLKKSLQINDLLI